MPFFSVSKYEKKYRMESFREQMIQKIQEDQLCSREFAVRYYDYSKQMASHTTLKLTSGLLYMYGAHKFCQMISKDIPLVSKSFFKLPILASGFYLGAILYDKLAFHYLNPDNSQTAHLWELDYSYHYNVKAEEKDLDIPLTPYDWMKKELVHNLDSLNVEGDKVFKRLSKDRNDFFYMFGKVRNLENIVYLDPEEVINSKSAIELQMKIDSVKPTLITTGNMNKAVDKLHDTVEEGKYLLENSKNFRSIKDKFLGLPFMLNRHQQFPVPSRGTWQFNVYEHVFGEAYDIGQGQAEIEEKVNKFNYHLFLHPSVIEKFDTNSEEFDMYLRKLNMESLTQKELRAKQREFFCKRILPVLNLSDDKEVGFDFANYVVNKSRSSEYEGYLHDQYSGQKEEHLFREMEEARYVDKNPPFVQRVSFSNIIPGRIGVRAKEMDELLTNPTAIKKMRNAMELRYEFYEPAKIVDHKRLQANQENYYNTIIDREIDTTSPDFKMEDLEAAQNDRGEGGDNPEEEALMASHINVNFIPGMENNHNPYGITHDNTMAYFSFLDFNDYAPDSKATTIFVSPKNRRFEMSERTNRQHLERLFWRSFDSLEFAERSAYIVPSEDYKDEELKSRVLWRSNFHRFLDNMELRNSDCVKRDFLESRSMDDSYAVSDDVTEEQLDQALFESTYTKPYYESEEYKGLFKRNTRETEQLFKILDFEPHERWYDVTPTQPLALGTPYTDKAQMIDPLIRLISEVEQPTKLRSYVKKWRSGAEMRFKLPYYPDTKDPSKTFNYI